MCPPTLVVELALTTIAIAFQRIRLLMRTSGLPIAGIRRLIFDGNGVDVGRIEAARQFMFGGAQLVRELFPAIRRCAPCLAFRAPVPRPIAWNWRVFAVGAGGGGGRPRTEDFFLVLIVLTQKCFAGGKLVAGCAPARAPD